MTLRLFYPWPKEVTISVLYCMNNLEDFLPDASRVASFSPIGHSREEETSWKTRKKVKTMHKGKNKKTRGWSRAEKKGSHCGSWEKEEGEMDVSVQFLAISEKRPIMWKWQGAGCNYNMFWSTCSNWRMLWQQICYWGNCQFQNSYQPIRP